MFSLEAVKTPDGDDDLKELSELKTIVGKTHDYLLFQINGSNLTFNSGLVPFLKESRNYSELEKVWIDYHNNVAKIKDNFTKIIEILDKTIKNHNYSDLDQVWKLIKYENESIDLSMDKLMKEVRPLYTELHAYVKHKLTIFYQKSNVNLTDKFGNYLPVHILGDPFGQDWKNIYDILIPYPNVTKDYNITQLLIEKNYNVTQIAKLAENFFISFGFEPMPEKFWKNSIFEKPKDADPNTFFCNLGVYDMHLGDDYRIKICGEVDENTFLMMHFLMGHLVYFRAYKDQPITFAKPANEAFIYAFCEAVVLSINTEAHLKKIGLLSVEEENENKTKETRTINKLLEQALLHIPFISFAYSMESWRTKVFKGEISKDQYNQQWWEIRKNNSGIVPPKTRNEAYLFDAGSKYHITYFINYRRFFFGCISQFEFYQALCGENENLHECDFKDSKGGEKIKELMTPGRSKPWPELLIKLTGRNEFNSGAFLNYFKPLFNFLIDYNKQNNVNVGWESL